MSYWHYEDGTPAPWGEGKFDYIHLLPWVIMILLGFAITFGGCGR